MTDKIRKNEKIKKPISRTLFIRAIIGLIILSILFAVVSYFTFSKYIYSNINDELINLTVYIESKIDADDLNICLQTGVRSEKYEELQKFLNGIIDDFSIEYLYIVIPKETVMVNACSATSAEERANGEEDMALLEETDAYSASELARFRSYWNKEDINFFEEASDYGTFYTSIKPLRDSKGETIALICIDKSVDLVHNELKNFVLNVIFLIFLATISAALLIILWVRKNVTKPLASLEKSTRDFSEQNFENSNLNNLKYQKPKITTKNEIQVLGDTINDMTIQIRNKIKENYEAEKKVIETEEKLSKMKIDELTSSMTSLLKNIPAMTFSKDFENGKYLACNQAFANYANKGTPNGVIGLSDYDIFDEKTAKHFIEDDKKAISMNEPYIFFEDVLDGAGNKKQFQTTKLKFTDANGKLCLLGMSVDVTEVEKNRLEMIKTKEAYKEAKSESVTYASIARALSADYSYIYYVDLTSEDFIEYSSNVSKENLVEERHGTNFFAQSRKDALKFLYVDDQKTFIDAFYKENVLENINKNGAFTITYRLMVNKVPTYVSMKISKMYNDENHIIIGVNNVDAQMKYKEAVERMKEERLTYSRITALSGDFICIYTVDPNTDEYLQYSATSTYEGLGLATSGSHFFEEALINSKERIYQEDIDRFEKVFTKDNILSTIKKNGLFVIDYRLILNNIPTYVTLKAAIVEEKDGPQLIIGVINVDTQKKREQEYAFKLAVETEKANIDALTNVKNKHAYVDEETVLNEKIENKIDVEFALVVFDVNGLKQVNDTYGHNAGDNLIKEASNIICKIFKHSPVFRVGGDEFVVIAKNEDYKNIENLVYQIALSNDKNAKEGGAIIACGMAKYNGDRNVATVFEKADSIMYKNKAFLKRKKQ